MSSSIECAAFVIIAHNAKVQTSQAGKQFLRINARSGEGDTAQFLNITAFDDETIAAADTFKQGARLYIEGRISLDTWTGKDGKARHSLSVRARYCRLAQIGRNRSKPARNKVAPAPASAASFDDQIPFFMEWRG